jgi:rhamnosyltransferase
MAAESLPAAEILVYMTQDAHLLTPDSVAELIRPFQDPSIGAAYGRQLPRPDAGALERHARAFNYPDQSAVRSLDDAPRLGIRATFLSNSFSAYRRSALLAVGGFPADTIMAEDTLVAAKLLLAGWKTAYVAEATVLHSHPYTIVEEFKRYFDTGVYHIREPWLLQRFGTASGEGKRFVLSELRSLCPSNIHLMPVAALRTLSKYLGYQLGRREASIPLSLKRRLSLHKRFWDTPATL